MTDGLELRYGSASHVGLVRAANEDAVLMRPPVFLVADGMGGHAHGRQAADAVVESFRHAADGGTFGSETLHAAVEAAEDAVAAIDVEALQSWPGSTVSGVSLMNEGGQPCWFVFNIGDSRVYLARDGRLEQISVDHSRRQELLDAGLISEGETTREDHVITRAIGAGAGHTLADQWLLPARDGDRILVCTDGLTRDLSHAELAEVALRQTEPRDLAHDLVSCALAVGGRDNVSVVIVEIHAGAAAPTEAVEFTVPLSTPVAHPEETQP